MYPFFPKTVRVLNLPNVKLTWCLISGLLWDARCIAVWTENSWGVCWPDSGSLFYLLILMNEYVLVGLDQFNDTKTVLTGYTMQWLWKERNSFLPLALSQVLLLWFLQHKTCMIKIHEDYEQLKCREQELTM